MSQLSLNVGGRTYAVSCADGEEDHIRHLASLIDAKMAQVGNAFSAGDPRRLLFAALFLAHEAEEARAAAASLGGSPDDNGASVLEAMATRLEKVATDLENRAASPR